MAVQRINHIQVNEAYEDFMVDTHRYNVLFGSAGCFDSETLVNTSTGFKRICDVEIGDMVLSFNETLLTPEYKQVVNKFCYEVRTIGQKMITFAFDNQLIKCTHGHKFYYKGTWIEASELAIRILERSGFGKRNILHQRFRSFINDKPLWFGEDGNNEACTGWKWIFSYCNSKKRQTEEIVYNKGSQTCCGSVCSEPNQSAGSESQGRGESEQCCGELGMGNSQAKHSTLICKQTTNQYRVEEPNKQTNGKGCCRNKACTTSVNNSKENRFSSEVWSSNRHYKAYCVQTGQVLDSCEIDIDNVKTITFSDESQLVYDLQVEDNSNYCITTDNIIVHNSGKSAAAAQKIILRCITEVGTMEEPFRHIITVVRKYKTTLRGTVFEQIKGECMRMGIDEMMTINESYGVFKFWNGAEIRLIGLDDPEKIKSLVSTGCWIEEATELEEADFSQLDLRFRGEAPYCKQLILSFNPVNQSHWIKRRFFDTPQNGFTYVLHTTYKDNYFIDQQYKKLLEEQYKFDENLYRIYVLGEWGRIKTGSDFFFNFRHDKHVHKVNYEKGLPLHISFDWNVSPYISAVVSQIVKREIVDAKGVLKPYYFIRVLGEHALPNPYNSTESLCDDIILKWKDELKYGVYIYGDISGRARSTRSNLNDFDIVEHMFEKYLNNYSFRLPKSNPLVGRRRVFIAKLMYGGFNIELAVDPSCKKLIGDFENTIENAEGGVHKSTARDPVSGVVYEKYSHHSDAFSYFVCEAFSGHFDSMGG